jgi:phospholipase C
MRCSLPLNYWEKTLLIITYDEPGGLYDHVSPVAITKPASTTVGGSSVAIPSVDYTLDTAAREFDYNVTGGRVPAIIVSPYVTQGSTITAPEGGQVFDHTSIIKTVWDIFQHTLIG